MHGRSAKDDRAQTFSTTDVLSADESSLVAIRYGDVSSDVVRESAWRCSVQPAVTHHAKVPSPCRLR